MAIVTDAEVLTMLGGSASAADTAILTALRPKAERLVQKFIGYRVERNTTVTEYLPLVDEGRTRDELIDGWEVQGSRVVAYSNRHDASRVLRLGTLPVRALIALYENLAAWDTAGGDWPENTRLSEGPDFFADFGEELNGVKLCWSGQVFRKSGAWPNSPRCVKVVYEAGLTSAELTNEFPELAQAVILATIKAFNQIKAMQGYAKGNSGIGPVTGWGLADFHENYDTATLQKLSGMMTSLPREAMEMLESWVNYTRFLG
jgi:hypothetical protein